MMCLLFQRHQAASLSAGPAPLLALARRAPVAPAWYGLYRGPRKLGYATVAADADVVGDAVVYRLTLHARLALPETVTVWGEAIVRDPGGLSGFVLEARSGAGGFLVRGTVRDGELLLDRKGGPARDSRERNLQPMGSAGKACVPLAGIGETGVTVRDMGEAVVNMTGALTTARRYLLSTQAGEAGVWVDTRGEVLRAEFPGGFSAAREPRALAERAGD